MECPKCKGFLINECDVKRIIKDGEDSLALITYRFYTCHSCRTNFYEELDTIADIEQLPKEKGGT